LLVVDNCCGIAAQKVLHVVGPAPAPIHWPVLIPSHTTTTSSVPKVNKFYPTPLWRLLLGCCAVGGGGGGGGGGRRIGRQSGLFDWWMVARIRLYQHACTLADYLLPQGETPSAFD
jgi:hypothetical protein